MLPVHPPWMLGHKRKRNTRVAATRAPHTNRTASTTLFQACTRYRVTIWSTLEAGGHRPEIARHSRQLARDCDRF